MQVRLGVLVGRVGVGVGVGKGVSGSMVVVVDAMIGWVPSALTVAVLTIPPKPSG